MSSRNRTVFALLALVFAAALPALAQPTCSASEENLMQWPDTDPVWEFCWVRPSDSSAPNGSGLEIRDVYYNGIMVFKRAHAPILNVDYDSGLCFRDWSYSEREFRADNQVFPGYYEPTFPATTVCDVSNTGTWEGDCPWGMSPSYCVDGVAAEKYADRLVLTTQMSAGWYRYAMRWIFHLDGTIEPRFGFGTYSDAQSNFTHRHHNYWRLDFDIDGSGDDYVLEQGLTPTQLTTEQDRTWG